MLPIPLCLSSEHIAAARAVLCPGVKRGTLVRAEVLEVPSLACRARSVGGMGVDAVLVVGRLAVCQDARLVDRQPEAVRKRCHHHRHGLDLRGRRRLRAEMFRRCTTGSENGNAHTPAVAPIGRGEQRIKRTIADHIERTVRIDLDMIVGEELPVVPRRPVEVDLSLLLVA